MASACCWRLLLMIEQHTLSFDWDTPREWDILPVNCKPAVADDYLENAVAAAVDLHFPETRQLVAPAVELRPYSKKIAHHQLLLLSPMSMMITYEPRTIPMKQLFDDELLQTLPADNPPSEKPHHL